MQAELKRRGLTNPTDPEIEAAEHVVVEQVKAAMLISGADRRKFEKLKNELANNYLLGTDQYPDTLEKAGRILSNYQSTNISAPFRGNPNDTGVAFLQRGDEAAEAAEEAEQAAEPRTKEAAPAKEQELETMSAR